MEEQDEFVNHLRSRIEFLRTELGGLRKLLERSVALMQAITRVHVLPAQLGKIEMGDDEGTIDLTYIYEATLEALRLGNNTGILYLGDDTTFLGLGT